MISKNEVNLLVEGRNKVARVMLIAGGRWQVDLAKKIKEMGHWVLCTNLYENSPAFRYSDACEIVDIKDKEKNLEIAKKWCIDAVLSDQSDLAIPTVAYIAEKMKLPGIGTEIADICTDKSVMRRFCKKNNVMIPDFTTCISVVKAKQMLQKYGRIVIKPIDSQSARGVFIIDNVEDLERVFPIAMSYSNRRKEILAEEYIGGTEFTIDGLVVNGTHFPLCISYKDMHQKNSSVSMTQTYSYYSNTYDYDKLRRLNKNLVEKIGIPFGLTHTEYRFYNGNYYLLEIAARGGGSNLASKIVPYMSGIDNYSYLIKSALGEKTNDDELKTINPCDEKFAIMQFFDFGSGKIREIKGVNRLKESRFLLDYNINASVGDFIEEPKFGSMRPGHFTIAGNNLKELVDEKNILLREVIVELE